ncbi:MAG: penicillin-binding protein 1C [Chloroflexi bacterium]|nr:penicillin-binding protein 1C [Chloroflexota bacterium]
MRGMRRPWLHTLWQGVLLGLLGALLLLLIGFGAAVGIYGYYAASLPAPAELHQRAAAFKSTKIYDRRGRLLYEVFDPTGGKRTLVRLDEVPRHTIEAIVATEDETFFTNPGLNPFSILRALYQDLRQGELVQGGSTITQQVVKNLFLTRERTLSRKIKEAILAAELTRRYTKAEILEAYLNEVYFGNLAYGLGAAAETYFGKHVSRLTLAESALLAGLIQSPALYDPYTDPQAALNRRAAVLRLMRENGYITAAQQQEALAAPLALVPRDVVMEAPHMVMFVREQLERLYGTQTLYGSGLQVYTTLDIELQHMAEEVIRQHMPALREYKATNAALVAIDPTTGDILAMVGSADFYSREIDGQVNVTRQLRQPGSTIKPFTYLAAFERGWTPATMLMDVRQAFPDGANPPYVPENYDHKEWGPVSLRMALASSRNIPAVSTLHQVGLPALLELSQRLGILSLNRPDYGLSLTLGGGDVTLLEMTAAYGALANGGRRVTPRSVLHIEDQRGNVLLEQKAAPMEQAVDPRYAYLITDILADNAARTPAFGAQSPLLLSVPAAVKTGTTDDYRDSWTVGYTPELVVGVWVGNNDNTPMEGLSGSKGAARIWHDVMEKAVAGRPVTGFPRPDGLVEVIVCAVSGQRPTEHCPATRTEWFPAERLPGTCTVHRIVGICRASGKLATEFCPLEGVEERVVEDYGPSFDSWARERGLSVPPREPCPLHRQPARVEIRVERSSESNTLRIMGTTEVVDFAAYWVEYGQGEAPNGWIPLTPHIVSPVHNGVLCLWSPTGMAPGQYTLRLVVSDRYGHLYQASTMAWVEEPAQLTATAAVAIPSPNATWPLPWPTPTSPPSRTATPPLIRPNWGPTPVATQGGMISETPHRPPRR